MQKISHDAVSELLTSTAAPAVTVTIYIPMETTASPPHITENQIRFKNLIHKADTELKAKDGKGDESKLGQELCNLLDTYYDDLEFWKAQTRGLLICAAPGNVQMFNLPVDTEEYVSVDDGFHLAPILALLGDAHEYYILALAQQHPRLYKADMYGASEVEGVLPTSLADALRIDELNVENENQGSATGSSMNTGWFNGRGGAHDLANVDRSKYFHRLDKMIYEKLDKSLPLILTGTEDETAEFRSISSHPKILQGTIAGNHTETPANELFEKALDIVNAELVAPAHQAAREEYEQISGANPDRVAHTHAAIMEAAEQGRVDKLLAMMSRHTTDTVQDKVESVFRITFPSADHSKILNKLAAKVWQMRGKVVSLLPNEMPNGAPMVARLRY